MELKGSKTEKNLMTAFAGESMARNKYTYFASTAKKEGYEQISAIFLETANNEKEHAKLWFKLLDGIGNTMDNLKLLLPEKMKNIQICIQLLQRKQEKKVLTILQNSLI